MADADLYTALGVGRGASAEEIKQAYRRLARLLHPDRNGDDPKAADRFRRISHAYAVLSDRRRRRLYDRFGEGGLRGSSARGGTERPDPAGPDEASADVGSSGRASDQERRSEERDAPASTDFDELFRRMRRGRSRRRGADLVCEIFLELQEAVRGCVRELRVKGRAGAAPRMVRVRIPPGVQPGERLRLRGLGRPGARGGEAGDLWLRMRIRSHPCFFLERGELQAHLPITPLEAYAGATVTVPTPHGTVQVRVPPRSQSGMKLRVRGHGVRRGDGEAGSLILNLRVLLPTADGLGGIFQPIEAALGAEVRRSLRFD